MLQSVLSWRLPGGSEDNQGHRDRFRAPAKTFFWGGPQARAERIKIFSLIRKDGLSVADTIVRGLKRLICAVDR